MKHALGRSHHEQSVPDARRVAGTGARSARRRARVEALESRLLLAATPVPIENFSFESAAAEDGRSAQAASWGQGNFNPGEGSYTNAIDGTGTAGVLPGTGDGKQALFINLAGTAGQTLANTLAAADTLYTLTVAVGNRGDVLMESYRVSLFAGKTELATAEGDGEDVENFTFEDVTATSAPLAASDPAVGQPLRIELSNLNNKEDRRNDNVQVNFDNVRLTAADADVTPPTASVTVPVIVPGEDSSEFEVQYADDVAIDDASIGAGDVDVLGPDGAPLDVTLQDVSVKSGAATATWLIAAPGGEWDSADDGAYTIRVNAGVTDTSGNEVEPTTATFAFVGPDPDLEPPDAVLVASAAPLPGTTTYDFQVTYTDDVELNAQGGDNDIVVTGPNQFVEFATFVGSIPDQGTSTGETLVYRINAPGGTFDTSDAGTYTVETFEMSSVTDRSGNRVRERVAGTFVVGLDTGPAATFPALQSAPALDDVFYDFDVSFEDATLVNAATIDGGDVVVTGPNDFSAAATLVSGGLGNGESVVPRYRIIAPGGSFDGADDGTYTINLQAGAVADIDGNFAPAGLVGTFDVDLTPPEPGAVDPTFGGGDGVATITPPDPLRTTDFIPLDDGGSIAVAHTVDSLGSADVTLFRVTFGGLLDPTFGGSNTGSVSLDVGADDRPTSLVRLADGDLLVTGTTSTYDGAGVETDADFFVARFNADGTLDTTFGDTGGFTTAEFGPASFDRANDQVVAPDGRIYLFGQSTVADPNGDFALARFDANGAFDPAFGAGGRVVTDLGGADVANAAALDVDGRLVAAGSTASGSTGSFAVVRYNLDGSVDNSFGPDGTGRNLVDFRPGLDEAQGIVRHDDGKLVAGGLATSGDPDDPGFDSDFAVVRFDANGNLDAGFGSGGKVLTDFAGQLASINKLIFQPGNKVVASGQVVTNLGGVGVEDVKVAIARYNADGSPDATFNDDGKLVIDFTSVGASSSAPFGAVSRLAGTSLSGGTAAGTELEEKFEQFRLESQGLVALTKGGAILLLATEGPVVQIARIVADGGAPSLFLAVIPNISEIDVTAATFVVRYVDDQAVDVARLGTGDIRVTGPNGFNQLAEFVGVIEGNTNAPERTVRYRVKPGGAAFVKADEGAYQLAVEPNRVADINGNALPAGPIPNAVFTITIPENLANLRVDGPLTGKFPAAVVGGSKAAGGTVRVTNSGDLDARTTVAVTLFASADAAFDEGVDTAIVTINGVKISLKPGKSRALKLKFTQFPSGLPDGDYFLIARVDSANAVAELKESDNVAPTAAAMNIAAPFFDLSGTPGALKLPRTPGGKGTGSAFVRNGGNSALKQTSAAALLASLDGTVGNDTAVGSTALKLNLKAGASKSMGLSFTLPAGLAPGTYTLLAVLDDPSVIAESDEANNVVVLGTFTV